MVFKTVDQSAALRLHSPLHQCEVFGAWVAVRGSPLLASVWTAATRAVEDRRFSKTMVLLLHATRAPPLHLRRAGGKIGSPSGVAKGGFPSPRCEAQSTRSIQPKRRLMTLMASGWGDRISCSGWSLTGTRVRQDRPSRACRRWGRRWKTTCTRSRSRLKLLSADTPRHGGAMLNRKPDQRHETNLATVSE